MKKFSAVLLTGVFILGGAWESKAMPTYWESNYGIHSDLSDEDDDTEEHALGFNFVFYGTTYDSVYINSNGALAFEDDDDDYEVGSDIEYEYGPVIAPFWADLYPDEEGDIYYNTLGGAGDRRFVVTWDDVMDYGEEFNNTFQAVLYENGSIQFGYQSLLGSDDGDGDDVIGVSQGDGTHFNYFTADTGTSSGIFPNGDNLIYSWNSTTSNYDASVVPGSSSVPEPSSMLLFGTGIVGLVGTRIRKRKK